MVIRETLTEATKNPSINLEHVSTRRPFDESQQPFDRALDVVSFGGLGSTFRQFVSFARRRGKCQEKV